MITHEEANELLASFALDAVDGDEHGRIEQHLAECPRCRAELDAFRDVAAAMGNSVEPLPEGLWSNISSRLPERQGEEPPPMPRLVHEEIGEDDRLSILSLSSLAPGSPVHCRVAKPDGSMADFACTHTFSPDQLDWFNAGSALNVIRRRRLATESGVTSVAPLV